MIRYTVLWSKQAEDELADLWTHPSRRREVTAATDHLDSELQSNAQDKGFVLPLGLKAISRSSITLYFRVDEADRKVFVEAIHLTEIN
jgi:hypothetical protein